MIGWLWRVIFGRFTICRHEWETMTKGPLKGANAMGEWCGQRVELRCKKCGDWKKKDLL